MLPHLDAEKRSFSVWGRGRGAASAVGGARPLILLTGCGRSLNNCQEIPELSEEVQECPVVGRSPW